MGGVQVYRSNRLQAQVSEWNRATAGGGGGGTAGEETPVVSAATVEIAERMEKKLFKVPLGPHTAQLALCCCVAALLAACRLQSADCRV